MTYIVTWTSAAIQQLAQLDATAEDKARFRDASYWTDYALRRMPTDLGESREANERLWYGDVLGVYFRVDRDALTVRVLTVGPARRR